MELEDARQGLLLLTSAVERFGAIDNQNLQQGAADLCESSRAAFLRLICLSDRYTLIVEARSIYKLHKDAEELLRRKLEGKTGLPDYVSTIADRRQDMIGYLPIDYLPLDDRYLFSTAKNAS